MNKDLVPLDDFIEIDKSEDEDLREKLRLIQRENFNHALECLITGKTPPSDFPNGVIPTRIVSKDIPEMQYIPHWWFTKQANALFGHMWSLTITNREVGKHQIWVQVRIKIEKPGKTVTEKFPDGRIVTTRYDPVIIEKEQFGSSDIKVFSKGDKAGQMMDIGNDLKSAVSDGKKKAFSELGLGADVYGKKELLQETSPTAKDLEKLFNRAESAGLTKEQVDEIRVRLFTDKDYSELNQLQIMAIRREVEKLAKEKRVEENEDKLT